MNSIVLFVRIQFFTISFGSSGFFILIFLVFFILFFLFSFFSKGIIKNFIIISINIFLIITGITKRLKNSQTLKSFNDIICAGCGKFCPFHYFCYPNDWLAKQ